MNAVRNDYIVFSVFLYFVAPWLPPLESKAHPTVWNWDVC